MFVLFSTNQQFEGTVSPFRILGLMSHVTIITIVPSPRRGFGFEGAF